MHSFITGAKVEMSERDGRAHYRVVFDKQDKNWTDDVFKRHSFPDHSIIETNGVILPWNSHAGTLLEIVGPYEFKARYPHL